MLRTERLIARQVWDTAFKNRAIFGLLIGIGLLLVYAAIAGWMTFQQQTAMGQKYQQQARHDWLSNPDKHPHRMAHYGHFAFRPKAPLSVFDFGMENFLGNTLFLEAHKQNTVNFSDAGFSTGMLRFGEISLAMILQLLLPLLLFFLGFGTVATERETGTLKLVLSQGVSWQQLITGKSLGLVSVMLALFGPVVLTTSLLCFSLQGGIFTADQAIRLVLLMLAYFLYLTFFCVIAVLVSVRSQTAKTALVSLIGLWLMLTLVLPRASQALGSYLHPAPSKARFLAAIQADVLLEGDSHNPNDPHYKALKDSLLAAYQVATVQQLPINYSGFVMAEGEKISAHLYNEHFNQLLAIYDQQNRFSKAMAFLNPYLAIRNLSMALSGTDFASYVDFQQQAEQYRYDMAQTINDLQIRYISNKKLGPTDKPYQIDHKYWQQIPDFTYQAPVVASVFRHEIISLLAFAFWSVLLVVIAGRLTKTLKAI
ncbi:ABC transporter permease [Spirosoma lituiforme]